MTELEQCVLGVVWRDGPVTAYEIAALFARSLSPYWSGSAGAIYPAVARLRRRGLVRGVRRAWNGGLKTVLTATDAGIAALRAWLTPPLPADAAAPTYDPLRTRLFFAAVLSPARRRRLLADAERVVLEQLDAIRLQHAADLAAGDESEAIGSRGVALELEARLQWLREIRKRLETEY